jgi:hypothetical protein
MALMPIKDAIGIVALATLFVLSPSPPPDTVTFTLAAAGALLATFITRLILGKPVVTAKASERVQVRLLNVQVHPVPLIAVADKPGSRVATAVTVPVEGMFPLLKISAEALMLVCP